MPRKTAAQKLTAYSTYYDTVPENPLITMRTERDLTQIEFAAKLGVNRSVINEAEDGMYSIIPKAYRLLIPRILDANKEYQAHRTAKRLYFFDRMDFPDHPARTGPMRALLEHFDLKLYTFGARACVGTGEIAKMLKDSRQITENFWSFLQTINMPQDWIDEFNAALQRSNRARVRI